MRILDGYLARLSKLWSNVLKNEYPTRQLGLRKCVLS